MIEQPSTFTSALLCYSINLAFKKDYKEWRKSREKMEKKQLADSNVTEWLKLWDRRFKITMIYMLRAQILKADNTRINACKKWDEYSKKESYRNARNQKHHAATAAKSPQSCPTLWDSIEVSPLGSSVPGILQARILEWVAFSNEWKWKVKVKSLSRAQLLATPWTAAHQAPPSMGFSRQKYWNGVPLPSPQKHHNIYK